MRDFFGVKFRKGSVRGVPKKWDLVSFDGKIVGDAKFFSLVRGEKLPPAKFSNIAEHVWLLEKVEADIKFLVFGNDRRVPEIWLERYGSLLERVRFFFIDHETGTVEELYKA